MTVALEPPDSGIPALRYILTGHFREGPDYHAYRKKGTRDYLLILTLSGTGRFGHSSGELHAEAGDWVMLEPGVRHDYATLGTSWELLWAHVQPRVHWHGWLKWPQVSPGIRHLRLEGERLERARTGFEQVHQLALCAPAPREAHAMHALEGVLLGAWGDSERLDSPIDPRIERTVRFLETHFAQPILLEQLTELSHLSASRFAHLFREQLGVSPQKYLETLRLERAMRLLSITTLSVEQVALEVGYGDPFYFSKRFSKHAGKSPRAFRKGAMGD